MSGWAGAAKGWDAFCGTESCLWLANLSTPKGLSNPKFYLKGWVLFSS